MSALRTLMLTLLVAAVASSIALSATQTMDQTRSSKLARVKAMMHRSATQGKGPMTPETAKKHEAAVNKAKSHMMTRPETTKKTESAVSKTKSHEKATTGKGPTMKTPSGEKKVYVHGYTRKDGTKVKGYWRTVPTKK